MDQAAFAKANASEHTSACDAARAALAKDAGNAALSANEKLACAGNAPQNLPKGMAANHELLSPADAAHSREVANLAKIDTALSRKSFFGGDYPDTDTLKTTLWQMNTVDRVQLQKDFASSKHDSLEHQLAAKYGTTSQDYQYLKGVLQRYDTPESQAAINLHMALWSIDETKRDQDNNDTATRTGYANNMIHHGRISPGVAGTLGAIGSFVDSSEISDKTKFAEDAIAKMSPQQVATIQKEHMRIYHRELGEMAEDTHGADPELVAAFERKGF